MSASFTQDYSCRPHATGPSCSYDTGLLKPATSGVTMANALYKITVLALQCLQPESSSLFAELPQEWRFIQMSFLNSIKKVALLFGLQSNIEKVGCSLIKLLNSSSADPTEYLLLYAIHMVFQRVHQFPWDDCVGVLMDDCYSSELDDRTKNLIAGQFFEFFVKSEDQKNLFMLRYAYPSSSSSTPMDSEQLQANLLALRTDYKIFKEAAASSQRRHLYNIELLQREIVSLRQELLSLRGGSLLDVSPITAPETSASESC